MPPSSKLIHRCAVRSWMSAAAAISVAFSFNCHKPITSNHSRGLNLLSAKIELVQSVHMANCWSKRTAQGTQLKRCSPLSHRSRGSTASLPQREPVVAPFTRLDRIVATAWTHDASGPAHLSQVISSFLFILQGRYQVFHRVAPRGYEQPHYTDTSWVKL